MLKYVGRRSISKYGCSGCHDIPGFEDAKSIGTSLADWGRKDPARLAFEQVGEYITKHAWPKGKESGGSSQESGKENLAHARMPTVGNAAPEDLEYAIAHDLPPTEGWLMEKLLGHEREGFIWQKLHAPRSYDFKKTENKGYNERLRMPQFPFKEDEIEAIMTFVLGLVAEPPASQYVASYSNNPRERAIIAGIKQVEQFNCTGCHQLDFERWDVAFKSGEMGVAVEPKDYPFELPHFTPERNRQVRTARSPWPFPRAALWPAAWFPPPANRPRPTKTKRAIRSKGAASACDSRYGAMCSWKASRGSSAQKSARAGKPHRGQILRAAAAIWGLDLSGGRGRRAEGEPQRQGRGSLGLAAAPIDRRRQKSANPMAARFLARSHGHSPGGRAADAEVQHELG